MSTVVAEVVDAFVMPTQTSINKPSSANVEVEDKNSTKVSVDGNVQETSSITICLEPTDLNSIKTAPVSLAVRVLV